MENRDYIVAIDLGTNTVSAVIGYKNVGGEFTVVDCATGDIQGMVRSEIKNIEQVVGGIKSVVDALESRNNIKIKEVYTGISGQHIRSVKYPYYVFVGHDGEVREDDVRKLNESMSNVKAPEGETIIQIMPQCYYIDGEETSAPVGAFGNKLEATFNFILAESSPVQRFQLALSRAGLKQAGFFVNAIAAAQAVTTDDEKDEGVAVVDIGAGMSDVTIFYRNIVRHVGIIPIGGNAINKDIRSYGILERHVENLKIKYGCAMRDRVTADKYIATPGLNARVPKEISFQNLAAIIEARMMDVVDFVMEEIEASGYKGKLGAGIVLTGGSSRLKDLDELFKLHTGMDVRVANPELGEDSVTAVKDPMYATAVGLMIKGAEKGCHTPVERLRRTQQQPPNPIHTHAQTSRTISVPPEHPVIEPVSQRTINDMYKDSDDIGIPDDIYETEGVSRRRGGIFSKLKDRFNNMFDVIEDNEI